MKRLFILMIIVATIATISTSCSSCERRSGRRPATSKSEKVFDTLIFTPDQIGVTDFSEEFIPFPNFDNGTGMKVSFSIGAKHGPKIYEMKTSEMSFARGDVSKEEMRNQKDIKEAVWIYNSLKIEKPANIKVFVTKGVVVKITKEPTFNGYNEFSPSQVIWEKKI